MLINILETAFSLIISLDEEGLSSDRLYISPDLNLDKDLNNIFEISST